MNATSQRSFSAIKWVKMQLYKTRSCEMGVQNVHRTQARKLQGPRRMEIPTLNFSAIKLKLLV